MLGEEPLRIGERPAPLRRIGRRGLRGISRSISASHGVAGVSWPGSQKWNGPELIQKSRARLEVS